MEKEKVLEKLKQINEAEGRAQEIKLVAEATAAGIRDVASALTENGGREAVNLRIAEQWVSQFGQLAKTNNTMIVPAQLGDVATLVSTVMKSMETMDASSPEESATEKNQTAS